MDAPDDSNIKSLFDALPDSLVLAILLKLDLRGIGHISATCRRIYRICEDDEIWLYYCKRVWLLHNIYDGETTWKGSFDRMIQDWGPYVHCYATIRTAWNTIFECIKMKCPKLCETLLPGVTEDQIRNAERQLGIKIPPDVACSYRICNGQRPCGENVAGLFGNYDIDVHNRGVGDYLLPLVRRHHSENFGDTDGEDGLAIIAGFGSKIFCCVQRTPVLKLNVGQMYSRQLRDPGSLQFAGKDVFIFAETFTEYMTSFANRLASGAFPIVDSLYIFKHQFNSQVSTGPINVIVETCFDRDHSRVGLPQDNPYYVFRYRITMKMDKDAHPRFSSQLETRHWTITDANGQVERVDGPGVVGEFPIMKPDSEHTWLSGTHFPTPSGTMHGYFRMRNLETGSITEVICPPFHMVAPPISRFVDR